MINIVLKLGYKARQQSNKNSLNPDLRNEKTGLQKLEMNALKVEMFCTCYWIKLHFLKKSSGEKGKLWGKGLKLKWAGQYYNAFV